MCAAPGWRWHRRPRLSRAVAPVAPSLVDGGVVAAAVFRFEFGAEAEDHSVGVAEVGDDLGEVEDLAVCEFDAAEGGDVRFGHGARCGREVASVGEHGAFTRRQIGPCAAFEVVGHRDPFAVEEASESGRMVRDAVGAAVQPTDFHADHLALDARER